MFDIYGCSGISLKYLIIDETVTRPLYFNLIFATYHCRSLEHISVCSVEQKKNANYAKRVSPQNKQTNLQMQAYQMTGKKIENNENMKKKEKKKERERKSNEL